MKLGLCQLDIIWEDKEANRAKAEIFVKKAAGEGVALLLFPEMSLTGFSMNLAKTAESARETVDYFKNSAAQYNIHIGFGWVESCRGKARNHYTIVAPDGGVLADYIKLHPFSFGGENEYFYPGDEIKGFSVGGFHIAPFICYDLRFPEIFQAVSGDAELLIVAANWPDKRSEHWRVLLQARAIENQAFVAGVNCVGDKGGLKYSGHSMIVDPQGIILRETTGFEDLICVDIDVKAVHEWRREFPLKDDRRNELYADLLIRGSVLKK